MDHTSSVDKEVTKLTKYFDNSGRQNELQWKPEYFPATRNWKVVALHNGVEVGTGISPNQKIAKEDAAREAVVYLRGKGMNIV